MSDDPKKLEAHLFVCTNKRSKGSCCADRGGEELRDELKDRVKKQHPEWKGRVRINASGCLGHCDEGITAVLYPEGNWFTELTPDSAPDLEKELSKLLDGR